MLVDHLLKTKNEFKETVNSRCVYQNKLDKGCFQHGMA